jgi:general secretion pathway protein E
MIAAALEAPAAMPAVLPAPFLPGNGVAAGAPSREFLDLIPRDFARQHLILSAGRTGDTEDLLVSASSSAAAIFNTGVRLGVPVRTTVADAETIARRIDEEYGRGRVGRADGEERADPTGSSEFEGSGLGSADRDVDRLLAQADRDLLSTSGKAPVVKLVDAILFEALSLRASDVHVQPLADRTLVRYRVDGVLHDVRELSPAISTAVVSRIKVMGRMDIAERRVPQDGRATVTIGSGGGTMGSSREAGRGRAAAGRCIDLRISTLPTSYGERAVLRLLDNATGGVGGGAASGSGRATLDLAALGMPEHVAPKYLNRVSRSSGIVLVTGPTGSGKTTTLYTTLRWVASRGGGELNVLTIEDPIEYELSTPIAHGDGINGRDGMGGGCVAISQAQVNTKKGVTFATGLRHILRQDPDVIMVGEIRDSETARIAIQASLTGHLVLSTLHTNDAAAAVTRLVDLGVEPYLVSASLAAVLAQRLVRTVHASPDCQGRGCPECFGSGLLGRTGVFELLLVDEPMRELIIRGATATAVRERARDLSGGQMRTLQEEAQRLVEAGITTESEVQRVILEV